MSSLQYLDLKFNNMNEIILKSFGKLSKLVQLYLEGNPWEDIITEVHLMNLTRLENIIIPPATKTSLVLNVTYKWIPFFRVKFLDLRNCQVGPRFSVWLQVQSELTSLILKNVGIEDNLPEEWLSKIFAHLTYLDLSNNRIKGKLPKKLESPILGFIDLSYNRFEENLLNGTIPSSICTMNSLQVLSLRTNQLSGELPQCWNGSQYLMVIDVENNNLSGIIPSLYMLVLSNNSLEGEIPSSLLNCSLLRIDLRGNRIFGKLPSWMGATTLWMLQLRSNSFSGIIPQKWCNNPFLHIFDLANNNISGVIPNYLHNLTNLVYDDACITEPREQRHGYVERTTLVEKGGELEYGNTLQYVNIIDLSQNNLM
ncbi:receptor-like protein EIX1, partial [Camellia sinensis]|uniref:receptor-like protein EIX1 n=1 Tax=Camellia sinensis TaxID=4442 RepID=UPI0010357DFD